MMSVRLDDELEARLRRAAGALQMSQSEFIRDALARRCHEVLGDSLEERLGPFLGRIESSGGRAESTGRAFQRVIRERKER